MIGLGDLIRYVVLAVLVAAQLALLRRARALAREDDEPQMQEMGRRFADDIRQRAARGEGSDWLRYRDELDRLFEVRDERLRSLAAAALAAGLGATLAAMLVSLVIGVTGQGEAQGLLAILTATGVCLLGSFAGVAVNLTIVLLLLPRAEARFSDLSVSFLLELERVASENRPREAFSATLREQLGAIRQALEAGVAQAFAGAVAGFPQMVERLATQVESLAGIVASQGQAVTGAMGELRACSSAVSEGSQRLAPATAELAKVASDLVTLPARLERVLEEGRDAWASGLREQQAEALRHLADLRREAEEAAAARERQMAGEVRELQAAVSEVKAAVADLPGLLSAEVARVAARLGQEFGSEARVHTQDLANQWSRDYRLLLERAELHEQRFRNDIGTAVEELLGQVAGRIEQGLVAELRAAAAGLGELAATLPDAVTALADAEASWVRAQDTALTSWSAVADRVEAAAERLAQSKDGLGRGVAALAKSAEHLERIAEVDGRFEDSLRAALSKVVDSHLSELAPLRHGMLEEAHELLQGRAWLNSVLAQLAEVIRCSVALLTDGPREPPETGL